MSTTAQFITAAQLEEHPQAERCELIQGELRFMSPAGAEHGWIIGRLTFRLFAFADERKLGYIFGAETGFVIERDPDTVRAPDVAFVAAHRISGRLTRKFLPFAPDLAVEVVSPDDSSSEVTAKAEQWLRSGSRVVWLVDPGRSSAAVATLEDDELVIRSVRKLTAPHVLPGFSLLVADIFA